MGKFAAKVAAFDALPAFEDANDEVKSIAKKMDECKADAEEAREETDKVKKRIKQIKNSLGGGLVEEPDAEKQEATQD